MKLNIAKYKLMLFNPTTNYDFVPEVEIEGNKLETMEELKMLRLILSNDLSQKTEHWCYGKESIQAALDD